MKRHNIKLDAGGYPIGTYKWVSGETADGYAVIIVDKGAFLHHTILEAVTLREVELQDLQMWSNEYNYTVTSVKLS